MIFNMETSIDNINKELEVNEVVKHTIEIKYKPAKTFRRIMANLLDFLIFVLVSIALFLASRAIIINTDNYQSAFNAYRFEQISSSLYVDDGSKSYPDIINFIDNKADYTHIGKHDKSRTAVINFYTYISSFLDDDENKVVQDKYIEFLTNEDLVDEDNNKYISSVSFNLNEVVIVENELSSASDFAYYNDVYKQFISKYLLEYFSNYSTTYRKNITYVSNLLVLVAVPISYCLSGILVYLIPPLIFKRGRRTLGKALYNIGLVDSRYLNVTWKRFLIRFLIFYFIDLKFYIFDLILLNSFFYNFYQNIYILFIT